VLAKLAAETMRCPLERVAVISATTDTTPSIRRVRFERTYFSAMPR